jgi:hypothetical protein
LLAAIFSPLSLKIRFFRLQKLLLLIAVPSFALGPSGLRLRVLASTLSHHNHADANVISRKLFIINYITTGGLTAPYPDAAPAAEAKIAMTQAESANPNPVQKSLVPMFRVWSRSIGWTIVLSTLLAVLFALALDGCSSIR